MRRSRCVAGDKLCHREGTCTTCDGMRNESRLPERKLKFAMKIEKSPVKRSPCTKGGTQRCRVGDACAFRSQLLIDNAVIRGTQIHIQLV
jgi:hypothetical protein